jgi:glycosyltransferase involved in cell wall biosynthesis
MDPEQSEREVLRIAIFHGGLTATGGEERIVLEQTLGLRRAGHLVECYCLVLDRRACYPELLEQVRPRRTIPFVPGHGILSKVLSILLTTLMAPISARNFSDFDIFLGTNQSGAWIAYRMAKLLNKPFAVYRTRPSRSSYRPKLIRSGGKSAERSALSLSGTIARISARFDATVMSAADVVLATSQHLADRLSAQYGRPFRVCSVGSHPQSKRVLRLKLPNANDGAFKLGDQIIDKPYLLVTSRHEARSRMESIIDVLARVKEDVPSVVLVITGARTSHTAALLDRAKRLHVEDRIVLTGSVPEADLQRLYREAAAYCHPEHYGGTGLGVVEAMAWGIPVVAWNHAATRTTVEDGKTGFLPEPNNVEAFADALAWLLQDRRLQRNLGVAGWSRAMQRFTWDNHAGLLEDALHRALERSAETKLLAAPDQVTADSDAEAEAIEGEAETSDIDSDAETADTDSEAEERQLPKVSVEAPAWAEAETEPMIWE